MVKHAAAVCAAVIRLDDAGVRALAGAPASAFRALDLVTHQVGTTTVGEGFDAQAGASEVNPVNRSVAKLIALERHTGVQALRWAETFARY
jgi:hypothetical protein